MNVLITGASGGLGRAFAIECARRGYNIFLTDINEKGLLSVMSGILRQYNVMIYIRPCDITNDDEVIALMDYIRQLDFKLDMLLNVAGIDHEGEFTKRNFKQISRILSVNIEATLRITYHALNIRRPNEKFYVAFVSSLASLYPIPLKATYAASKRFLLDFSIALGQELKEKNVSILSLCPAGLPTTQEAMSGIAAQGFWGSVTTNKLERVVDKAINYLLKGRHIYIPGLINRIFSLFSKFVPASLIAKLLYSRWIKAQQQWLVIE